MSNEIATKPKLVEIFADRYNVDPTKVLSALKTTAFRQSGDKDITNDQMMALLIVANQYKLNPFTKEIYAYPDKGSIIPVVSVDGWSRIMNSNSQMDGIEFEYSPETVEHKGHTCHVWIDCVIYRKDRSRPTKAREFFAEVVRSTAYASPWDTHPNRMHRHKAEIQCARIAFGFAGIYDQDEAERIMEGEIDVTTPTLQTASQHQKELYDGLIEADDALGMFVFCETIKESTRNDLYHSFPRGEKGKFQRVVDALYEKGHNVFADYQTVIGESMEAGDTLRISETVEELPEDAVSLMAERMGGDFVTVLAELSESELSESDKEAAV
jgi:phage recombination protein Bet